jgi:hypothetical protein
LELGRRLGDRGALESAAEAFGTMGAEDELARVVALQQGLSEESRWLAAAR